MTGLVPPQLARTVDAYAAAHVRPVSSALPVARSNTSETRPRRNPHAFARLDDKSRACGQSLRCIPDGGIGFGKLLDAGPGPKPQAAFLIDEDRLGARDAVDKAHDIGRFARRERDECGVVDDPDDEPRCASVIARVSR